MANAVQLACFPAISGKPSIPQLVQYAIELGATEYGGPLSKCERELVRSTHSLPRVSDLELFHIQEGIRLGRDPLGEMYCEALSPTERRPLGAFYTPADVVDFMVSWTLKQDPQRVVDAGAGSGRFSVAIATHRPEIEILAVDLDPVATLLCRAHLAQVGARNSRVLHSDYTQLDLPQFNGRTAFLGNPPYVRHHQISAESKAWAKRVAETLGLPFSGLAGLHVYFILATALHSRPGDVGCLITSAEWLDVGYGQVIRDLFCRILGVTDLVLFNPRSAQVFEDALSTALISKFQVAVKTEMVTTSLVEALDVPPFTREVPRTELKTSRRWSRLIGPERIDRVEGNYRDRVPLGALVKVSRGVATGANAFFVLTKEEVIDNGLLNYVHPVIISAKEIFDADGVIRANRCEHYLLNVPPNLDLSDKRHAALAAYVQKGEEDGVHKGFLCSNRKPWWSLRVRKAPPAVSTYMARQAPAFAYNPDNVLLLNIAHGLHPRVDLAEQELTALISWLNEHSHEFVGQGRTYHGGLEKFEPRELESILVPSLENLRDLAKGMNDRHAAAHSYAHPGRTRGRTPACN